VHEFDCRETAPASSTKPGATARFEPQALTGKSALSDDGLYCVLHAVFAPALPDPDGYSVTFPGTPISWDELSLDPWANPGEV
jgi:hypothetical protein